MEGTDALRQRAVDEFEHQFLTVGVDAICSIPASDWNWAHWGAGVVAACFFVRDQALGPETIGCIARQVQAMVAAQCRWFGTPAASDPGDPAVIVEALAEQPERLRALGHDLIFSTLVLRAFARRPELATTARIDGLIRVVVQIGSDGPGGPFPGWSDPGGVRVEHRDGIPIVDDDDHLARCTLDAFLDVGPAYPGLDQGVVHHLLTHAEALLRLRQLGCTELSLARREAHRRYLKLVRRRPSGPGALDARPPAVSRALATEFWARDHGADQLPWLLGHIFKVPASFHFLAEIARLGTRERDADEDFLAATLGFTDDVRRESVDAATSNTPTGSKSREHLAGWCLARGRDQRPWQRVIRTVTSGVSSGVSLTPWVRRLPMTDDGQRAELTALARLTSRRVMNWPG
jgi:hypothetical protein